MGIGFLHKESFFEYYELIKNGGGGGGTYIIKPEVLYDIFDLENVNMLKINYIYPYFEMTSS